MKRVRKAVSQIHLHHKPLEFDINGIKKHLALFLFLCTLFLLNAFSNANVLAEEIAVIGSGHKVYRDTLRGFESVCNAQIKEYQLQEYSKSALIENIINSRPKIILAIGQDSLDSVKEIKDIPVIAVMILNLGNNIQKGDAITGIDITLPVGKQLDELELVLPRAKRIGVIYNPNETGHIVKEAQSAASLRNLTLLSRPVKKPQDVITALNNLRDEIDVLWMLPDVTILNYEIIKYLMLFSYENNIPLYAFSEKYVKNSALMALGVDTYDIGSQAGEMANKILAGKNAKEIPIAHARKGELFINWSTAKRLGITIPSAAINKAERIYGMDK